MIDKCPIDAVGDSIVICKVGTISVNGKTPMTWLEYLSSEHSGGGQGALVLCETGQTFIDNPIPFDGGTLTYVDKHLNIDHRIAFDIYDSLDDKWLESVNLRAYNMKVYADNGKIKVTQDSLIFKPPFHGKRAFASVDSLYKEEQNRRDHYLISRIVKKLLACALSGDTLSEQRFLSLRTDFKDYYDNHPDSEEILDTRLMLYNDYKHYRDTTMAAISYYNLSEFMYWDTIYNKKLYIKD